jgi:Uma2 family endonuclease
MKVKVEATGRFYYPDVLIVCAPRFLDARRDVALNPSVLFEVLSESTEDYDRSHKFKAYGQIAGLTDYVLCSSQGVSVEHFTPGPGGSWVLREYGAGQVLPLTYHGIELSVDALYRGTFAAK